MTIRSARGDTIIVYKRYDNYLCTCDIYSPMHNILDACVYSTLRWKVGGGWTLEFPSFLGPVKWERADSEFHLGAKIWAFGKRRQDDL